MICLKSPKSSEFANLYNKRGQTLLTMLFFSLGFYNYLIEFSTLCRVLFQTFITTIQLNFQNSKI